MNTFTVPAMLLGLALIISVFDFSFSLGSTKIEETVYTNVDMQSEHVNSRSSDQVRVQDYSLMFPERDRYQSRHEYHQHYHAHDHKHDHDYDHKHDHDHDHNHEFHDPAYHQHLEDTLFTSRTTTSTTESPKYRNAFENSTGIPLDFLEKLNNNRYTVNDLLLHYVDDYQDTFLQSRFGEEERRTAQIPKDAKCIPELATVKLANSDDPNVLFIPSCTRIERCGGCCSHSLLSCQPTETETINYQVIKTKYTGGSKLKFLEKEIVLLEKHLKCACDCRVQAQDCTPVQEYRKNECRCACRNTDEEKKCYKNNQTRLWDPQSCSCKCREEKVCSTGTAFDWNQCKCVLIPMKRRFAEFPRQQSRTGYKSQALPVIPLKHVNNN